MLITFYFNLIETRKDGCSTQTKEQSPNPVEAKKIISGFGYFKKKKGRSA